MNQYELRYIQDQHDSFSVAADCLLSVSAQFWHCPPRSSLTERPRCKAVYFRFQHDSPNYVERSDAYDVRILESCPHLATSVGGIPDTQCDVTTGQACTVRSPTCPCCVITATRTATTMNTTTYIFRSCSAIFREKTKDTNRN